MEEQAVSEKEKKEKRDTAVQDTAVTETIEKIAFQLERSRIADYVALLDRPGKLLTLHLMTGIARGVGVAVGFTFVTTALLYSLRAIGALNLPIIGDYIADIVRIVQAQLNGGVF